jgi:hypothetical protein
MDHTRVQFAARCSLLALGRCVGQSAPMSMQMQLAIVSADEIATIGLDAGFDELIGLFERDGSVDLDKTWDAVQSLFIGVDPLFEGEAVGQDVGYGPARYVSGDRVREIAALISDADEASLFARFDQEALAARGAYPPIWDRPDDVADYREEAIEGALAVFDLYQRAAATDRGVLIVLW